MPQPDLILTPFAQDAPPSAVDPIPETRAPSDPLEKATWRDGFPSLTMIPLAAGGIPPRGQDFNGVLKAISEHTVYQGGGGQYKWDDAYVAAKGGYPKGAVLQSDDEASAYISLVNGNTDNFNADPGVIGSTWVPYAGEAAKPLSATQDRDGVVRLASEADASPATIEAADNAKAATILRVFQALRSALANASETLRGTLRIGTQAEVDAGTDDAVAVTPRTLMKGAGIHRRAVFFESGTWLCPPGVTSIQVTGCGGGGGGGGRVSGASSHGQGAGAGASALCVSLEVTPGAEYTVSIGAAGNGGGVGENGTAGGATSFASLLTLAGGAGGLAAGSGSGGVGGQPSPELPGTSRGCNGADGVAGGHGGSSPFGGGGLGRSSAGSVGQGWGSGGSGGYAGNGGGSGAPGFLIVEW